MSPVRFAALLFASSLLLAQKASWQPAFTEDFEGTRLNLARWIPRDPLAAPLATSPATAPGLLNVSAGQLHMSGPAAISTFGLFAQPYGRFEIRFRIAAAGDTKARFRLLPVPLAPLPAIDIFEVTASDKKKITFANSWGTPQTERSFGDSFAGPDLSAAFHTITLDWHHDNLTWFIDGKEKFHSSESVPSLPAYLLIDVPAGTLDIDYIRVWRRP